MALLVTTVPDGTVIDLDSLPHTFTWSGAYLSQDSVSTPAGHQYVQQYTYNTSNQLVGVTAWSKVS